MKINNKEMIKSIFKDKLGIELNDNILDKIIIKDRKN